MTYIANKDFKLEVRLGNVSGYSYKKLVGINPDVDIAAGEDAISWGGVYAGQDITYTVPELVTIVSTSAADGAAGTGVQEVTITGLKTATSTSYETEVLAMNGTTSVDSVNTWYRILPPVATAVGSGGVSAGNITVAAKTTTSVIFGVISTGDTEAYGAFYTVPYQKKAIMQYLRMAISGSGTATIVLKSRGSSGVFREHEKYVVSGERVIEYKGGEEFTSMSDVIVYVESVSADNTNVEVTMELFVK